MALLLIMGACAGRYRFPEPIYIPNEVRALPKAQRVQIDVPGGLPEIDGVAMPPYRGEVHHVYVAPGKHVIELSQPTGKTHFSVVNFLKNIADGAFSCTSASGGGQTRVVTCPQRSSSYHDEPEYEIVSETCELPAGKTYILTADYATGIAQLAEETEGGRIVHPSCVRGG